MVKRHVGGRHIFADGRVQRVGQALAAEFFRHGKTQPAALTIGVIGFLEALRHVDGGIVIALAAFLVAREVDREQHFFGKLRRFAGNRLDHVGRGFGKAGEVVVVLDAEHVVEDEKRIASTGAL